MLRLPRFCKLYVFLACFLLLFLSIPYFNNSANLFTFVTSAGVLLERAISSSYYMHELLAYNPLLFIAFPFSNGVFIYICYFRWPASRTGHTCRYHFPVSLFPCFLLLCIAVPSFNICVCFNKIFDITEFNVKTIERIRQRESQLYRVRKAG